MQHHARLRVTFVDLYVQRCLGRRAAAVQRPALGVDTHAVVEQEDVLEGDDLALHALLARDGLPSDQPAALLSPGEREKSRLTAVNHAVIQSELEPDPALTAVVDKWAPLAAEIGDVTGLPGRNAALAAVAEMAR